MRKEDKVLLYVAAAGVIAGLIGVWWFMSGSFNLNNQGGAAVGSKSISLKELLASKGPTTCSVSNTSGGGSSSGTVYIVSGLLRGDFTSVVGGSVVQSHLIIKDKFGYVWADKLAQGVKVPFDVNAANTTSSSTLSMLDPNAKANYTCTSWTSNANYFDLPTTVSFKSLPTTP